MANILEDNVLLSQCRFDENIQVRGATLACMCVYARRIEMTTCNKCMSLFWLTIPSNIAYIAYI